MYVDESIPSNYNKIAEITDNYIVLVKESKLVNNHNYEAYYQFFKPSTSVLFVDDYRITDGDSYTYNYNYVYNQMYSYIDSMDLEFSKNTMVLDDRSSNVFDRYDFCDLFLPIGFFLCVYILIFNLVSALVHKGGLFFG